MGRVSQYNGGRIMGGNRNWRRYDDLSLKDIWSDKIYYEHRAFRSWKERRLTPYKDGLPRQPKTLDRSFFEPVDDRDDIVNTMLAEFAATEAEYAARDEADRVYY